MPSDSNDINLDQEWAKLRAGDKGLALCREMAAITRAQGYNDYCPLIQAWHESGGFRSVIGSWNFWGIKKPQGWTGKIMSVKTKEFIHGNMSPVTAVFIDFDTCADALRWWSGLIQRLYPQAYLNRNNPDIFFRELVNPANKYQYATDNKYSQKLIALCNELKQDSQLTKILMSL